MQYARYCAAANALQAAVGLGYTTHCGIDWDHFGVDCCLGFYCATRLYTKQAFRQANHSARANCEGTLWVNDFNSSRDNDMRCSNQLVLVHQDASRVEYGCCEIRVSHQLKQQSLVTTQVQVRVVLC